MKVKSVAALILILGLALLAIPARDVYAQIRVLPHQQPAGEEGSLGVTGYDSFNNPGYYYAAIKVAPSDTWYRQAGLSPDGTKIVAQKSWNDGTYNRTEIVLMDADGAGETVVSAGDSDEGDIYGYMNPFWSDDGTAVGYAEVHKANPNKIVRYDLAGSTSTYLYEPVGEDANNCDFLGSSTTSIVCWDWIVADGAADLFIWDGSARTWITRTPDYSEYEPVSNGDGSVIVYWSGETAAEPVNTTHTLTNVGGTWTVDVGFTAIADTYWSGWSGRADNYIATTVMPSKDILIYDSSGTLVTDLTGPGYSGGSGQWNFFGVLAEGPNGNWVITSNAGRGGTAGRDIVCAASRLEMYVAPPPLGSDSNCGTEAAPFATIQKGVNEVIAGGTVHVAAGTYVEDPVIDKAVTLLGPNAGIDPSTGTREAEAIIFPAYSVPDPAVCEVIAWMGSVSGPTDVSNITIDGFTFDGDNPTLTSGIIIDGADVDACVLIGGWWGSYSNITIQNNILKHATYAGIDIANTAWTTTATAGNVITHNRFEDIGETTYNKGIGVITHYNVNADITYNVMTGIRVGIQTENITLASPGAPNTISNNTIGAWRLGVFHNTRSGTATTYTLANNTVTAESYPGITDKWNGILLSVHQGTADTIVSNNIITIPDALSYSDYSAGYNVWSTSSGLVAIEGGTITGGTYGIFVNNYEGYSDTSLNTFIDIDGVTILGSDGAGVYVKDNPLNTHGATVYADIQNCTIDTDATGILIEGEGATADAYHNRLGGNTTYGMNNMVVGVLTNAEYNYWGSVLPAEVAAEVTGDVDFQPWCNYDFTVCDFVFPVHNLTQLIDYPTIQSAVDDANPGDVIEADAGTYVEQVIVGKDLTIQGASIDAIIQAPVSVPTCFTTSAANKPIVCIKDNAEVTIDGFTIDGAGRGNANSRFVGVGFRNAGGTVENCVIKDIRDTPFSGAQHGVAIYAYNDDLTGRTINVWDNEIYGFQKNAMALNAGDTTPLAVDVQRNVVTGAGTTTVTAQNGIQVWADLASGTVAENTVTGIAYDGGGWVATSILNYYADLDINDNAISGAHMGVYNIDGSGQINGNILDIVKASGFAWGVLATDPPQAIPSPYGEETLGPERSMTRPEVTLAVDVSGNTVTFVGADNTSTYGIEADAGYGPDDLALTANGNTVTGFYVGIEIWHCQSSCDTGVFTSIFANDNCLSDNAYGMRSNATYLEADGTLNWWDDDSGPYHPTQNPSGLGDEVSDYVDFEPWIVEGCGSPNTEANWLNTTTDIRDDLQDSLDDALPGETIIPLGISPLGGGGVANQPGVTVDLIGKTVGPGSPAFTINANDITIKNGILDGWDGSANSADPAILVNAGAGNFILDGVWVTGWANGIELAGDVTSFKMASNWIHSNTGAGLLVDSGVDLAGVVTIEGNLFKVNGGSGVQHNGNGTLPAEYNSWGDIGGYATGDGIGGLVDADPFTYVESFFDVWPDALAIERHVPEGTSFDVALKADAVNVGAISFGFTYDPAVLTLNSATFASPWVTGSSFCFDFSTTGNVKYVCALLGSEWTATAGTIATFNFSAPTLLDDNPVTTYLDLSHLEADTSAAAIGGQKVFVNNAGFNLPSTATRDITDADDGRIIVERVANYTGLVDLQGRINDSGATIEVHATSIFASTLLAQATSTSSGAFTTVSVTGNWLGIGSTYWFQVDRALYLPTTVLYPAPAANYAHSKALTSPLTALAKVVLLGGDATDDETIQIDDVSCIGGSYGGAVVVCGVGGSSDVNGDGKVNVQDLSMAGGNLYKTSSPWTP